MSIRTVVRYKSNHRPVESFRKKPAPHALNFGQKGFGVCKSLLSKRDDALAVSTAMSFCMWRSLNIHTEDGTVGSSSYG